MFFIIYTSLISSSDFWKQNNLPPTWCLFLELIICFVKFRWHSDKDNLIRHLSNHTCILTATAGGGFFKTKPFRYYWGQHVFPGRFHIACTYVYIASFFSRVRITCCFPFEDFHVVWEYPYLEKLPLLRRCSSEKMLILHWWSTLKTITSGGCPQARNFLKPGRTFPFYHRAYMQTLFLLESSCCRSIPTHSMLLCSLQHHHVFHQKIQGEEHIYNSSIRNSLRKCLVVEVYK